MSDPDPRRPPGRPRDAAADEAILAAAQAILAEGGMRAVTMSAVVRRSGVARATLYRRFPTRQPLLNAAIRRSMGIPALQPVGELDADIRRAAEIGQRVLASPQLRAIFPALVEAVLAPEGDEHVSFDEIVPGRARFIARHQDALGPDAALAIDIVFGTLIGKLLSTGRPATRDEADAVAGVVLDGLKARATRRRHAEEPVSD